MPQGFVYILISPNSDHIKIGRTERPISERLRGVNGGEAYAPHGPWELSDFVHVTDCALVETAFSRKRTAGVGSLNIGPHEVAFSTRTPIEEKFSHYLVLDRLILEYPETIMWLGQRGGEVREAEYKAAERALLVSFDADFADAERFYSLKGVRRAIVAYWADALANLRERNARSVYARFHSYDAVSQLLQYKRQRDQVASVGLQNHADD